MKVVTINKKTYDHERYLKNKESIMQATMKWRKANPDKVKEINKRFNRSPKGIFKVLRNNNKNRANSLEMNRDEFTQWYLQQEKRCMYCGITEDNLSFLMRRPKEVYRITRLTLDRLDNQKGYSIDNIGLACHICNHVKSHIFTTEEMKEIATKYLRPRWEDLCA